MKESILIVEDEFIVANDLKLMLVKAGYSVCGIAVTVDSARSMINKYQPTWVLLDIFLQDDSLGTDLAKYLLDENIGFIYISANTTKDILDAAKETQPYGFLVKPFREKELLIMLEIARAKHQEKLSLAAQREDLLETQLQELAKRKEPLDHRLLALVNIFNRVIPFDMVKIIVFGKDDKVRRDSGFFRKSCAEFVMYTGAELLIEAGVPASELHRYRIFQPGSLKTGIFNNVEFRRTLMDDVWEKRLSSLYELQSRLVLRMKLENSDIAGIAFYSKSQDGYSNAHMGLLKNLLQSLEAIFSETPVMPEPVSNDHAIIDQALSANNERYPSYEGIVGSSPALLKIIENISLVAPAPISVLILGESGTGKERVAQAIHKKSNRHDKPLVIVNCAALAQDLIESELFGHEKGAFTGATDRRPGKFESADGGTIFLDEIGELPLEAQVKLLRVLQEHNFERVGSNRTINVDVRVIAATNRNLEQEVADGRIRLDLYYRLNVFPIELPPLRERPEDIRPLARHFIDKYAKKLNRQVTDIGENAITQLQNYDWPGNIRELEHIIERNLIIATGTRIDHISLPAAAQKLNIVMQQKQHKNTQFKTLEQIELEHIREVLLQCDGRISGAGGAAELLGIPSSTLNSKLKKLGIKRDFFF